LGVLGFSVCECECIVDATTVFVSGSEGWDFFFFLLVAILRSAFPSSSSIRRFTPAAPASKKSIGMATCVTNGAGLLGASFCWVALGEGPGVAFFGADAAF